MDEREQFRLDSEKLKADREEIEAQIRKVRADARTEIKRLQAEYYDLGKLLKGNRTKRAATEASLRAANRAYVERQIYLMDHPEKKNWPGKLMKKAVEDACQGTKANPKTVTRYIRQKISYLRIRTPEKLRRYPRK